MTFLQWKRLPFYRCIESSWLRTFTFISHISNHPNGALTFPMFLWSEFISWITYTLFGLLTLSLWLVGMFNLQFIQGWWWFLIDFCFVDTILCRVWQFGGKSMKNGVVECSVCHSKLVSPTTKTVSRAYDRYKSRVSSKQRALNIALVVGDCVLVGFQVKFISELVKLLLSYSLCMIIYKRFGRYAFYAYTSL